MNSRQMPPEEEAVFLKNYRSSQMPNSRRRVGAKHWFVLLLLLIAAGGVYAALNPWAFFLGGDFHPLGYWQGWGRMHSRAGDYFLYVNIYPNMRSRNTIVPGDGVTGDARLCTPKADHYYLHLGGGMPFGYYVNSLGKSIHIYMYNYRTLSPDDRPKFDLYGEWGRREVIADDRSTLSQAFLPDGTLRSNGSRVLPSETEDIQVTLHEGTYSEWKNACAAARHQRERGARFTPTRNRRSGRLAEKRDRIQRADEQQESEAKARHGTEGVEAMRIPLAPASLIGALLLLGGVLVAQQKASSDDAKDRAAIERTLKNLLNAWNTHDAHAFALTFTPDADFTNVIGMHAHGRANVETFHATVFATVFKHSHQTAQIRSIRFLAPRLAAVDVDWQMTGATDRDGHPRPDRKGLLDWIMAKQSDGSWLIEIMHNTELTNAPPAAK